jgi:hypothetical protein
MSQIFLIICSLIMAGVVLVVLGLSGRRKATLGRAYIALAGLMGGSCGAFFGAFFIGVQHLVKGDSPSYLPALLLAQLVVGLVLAIAAGAVFLWKRPRSS